ncbi:MAG: 2TM domain-containing protein [Croceitalea sp.]|nr:2TM domain-containing protein [Croceitalea sp.]NNL09441.1 2TM domain-containing protein [Croceitalea sp.]
MDINKNESKYMRAKERVDQLKKFYGNLTSYIVVITGLGILNYYTNGWRYMWFLWAAFGWGIGIFFHAINTFNLNPFFGRNWEKRKIQEFMEKDQDKNKWQ